VSDEVRPEDIEEIGLDPGILDTPIGRKDFFLHAAKLTAAAAAAGPFFMAAEHANAALRAMRRASANDPATTAVTAAQQFKGVTLNHTYESGLQALDPKNFSGPLWNKLTGINLSVIELDHASQFSKVVAAHLAHSGAYDIVDIEPAWIPSLADTGVLKPIDDYLKKYDPDGVMLGDLHPMYQPLGTWKGQRYGFFDDGDMFSVYYRTDIFSDPKLMKAYRAKYKRPLRVPRTWQEYAQVAHFITDALAPKVYGTGAFRKLNGPGNHWSFYQELFANGGQLFDPNTMKATINSAAGVKTLAQMIDQNKASIPGVTQMDAVSEWTAWCQGKLAMIFSWPPTGRISENYAQRSKAINFVPKSTIVGKVGYTLIPTGHGEMASGYCKAITSDSKNPEAAYLLMQWMCSPTISTQRVMLPYALRDPYRLSHYNSPKYRALWPSAKAYLVNLANAANQGVLNPIMPGTADMAVSLDRACTSAYAGTSPKSALDTAAKEWDDLTNKLGTDKQKEAYAAFLQLPGGSVKNTVAAAGKAVRIR
jgi:multiple sugar transport system substrate-binding protein